LGIREVRRSEQGVALDADQASSTQVFYEVSVKEAHEILELFLATVAAAADGVLELLIAEPGVQAIGVGTGIPMVDYALFVWSGNQSA
jgi:hypothetical protein